MRRPSRLPRHVRSHRCPPPMRRRNPTRDGREYPKTSLQASGLQHRKASISKAVNPLKIACCSTASAIFTDDKIGLIEASLEAGARNARVVGHDVSRATTRSIRSSNCCLVSSRSLLAARTQRPLVESSFVSGPLSWESAATGSAACWSLPR